MTGGGRLNPTWADRGEIVGMAEVAVGFKLTHAAGDKAKRPIWKP